MTARPGAKDLSKVPHHLYGHVDMLATYDFNVQKYVKEALAKIAEVVSRGKTPVIVGGTNYYIEALLFKKQSEKSELSAPDNELDNWESFHQRMGLLIVTLPEHLQLLANSFKTNIPPDNKQDIEDNFESPLCHELLQIADPKMAQFLHKNDKRKIVNALFKCFKN